MSWKFPYYNSTANSVDWTALEQFDWISDMRGVEQDKIWHGEGDVYTHTKMVVEAILSLPDFQNLSDEEKHILVTSAILHDVEKRSTTTVEDGHVRSHNHSKRGEKSARIILYREIPTPFHVREHIAKLVRLHGLPLNILDKKDPNRSVIESSLVVDNKLLMMLGTADILGRIANDNAEQLEKVEFFVEFCKLNECYYQPKEFKTNLARYKYLSDKASYVDYEPFDDTKFEVFMLSGIAGAGKDTYIKKNLDQYSVISLDAIRRQQNFEPGDKYGTGVVIQCAKEMSKVCMRRHESFVWNATNITKQLRQQLVELFTSYGGKVTIIYIEQPYKTLLAQNKNREHVVPDAVIEKMVNKLEIPTMDEAHDVIFVI